MSVTMSSTKCQIGSNLLRVRRKPSIAAMADSFLHGTAHQAPDDLRAAIESDPALLVLWQSLTPLGRNAFCCWVLDARQTATRARRIVRTGEELREGKRRPCCWAGCIHRADKAPSNWQQAVLVQGRQAGSNHPPG